MRRYIYETLHPEMYHGYKKRAPYFEGWYYKLISADEQTRFAIIPGIFRGQAGINDHCFIQVLDGMTGTATYHEYPLEAFHAAEESFDVHIGPNRFRKDYLKLAIDDPNRHVYGELHLEDGDGWPVSITQPGVMGWYAWMPFMECYHGLLSFEHRIDGTLQIGGGPVDFSGGRGYMEKDWGQAFPSAYIWFQSNHFDTVRTSISASIAMIPWIGRSFRGFLVGFTHYRKLYRFTTYTGAVTEHLELTDDLVHWTVADRNYRLAMTAERHSGGLLKAPIRTEMHKRVDETMQSTVTLHLTTRSGETIFKGHGRNASLEVHGDLETLLNTP